MKVVVQKEMESKVKLEILLSLRAMMSLDENMGSI